MSLRLSSLVAVVVGAVAMGANPPALSGQASGTRTIFASVVDGSGKPAKDLAKTDWALREDGVDRAIVDVKPADAPLEIVLLADTTKGIQEYVTDVRTALLTFTRAIHEAQPAAEISLMGYGNAATTIVPLTKTQADLEKAIQRLFPDQAGAGVLLEGIVDASRTLGKALSPRRAIVVFNLESAAEISQTVPQTVANAVFGAGVSLWAVSFRTGEVNTGSQARDIILGQLPPQSGGARLTVNARSAVEMALRQVADVLLSQYAVTYTRPEGPAPKAMQVGVTRPGSIVLASRTAPK